MYVGTSNLGMDKTVTITTRDSLREQQGGQAQAVMTVTCNKCYGRGCPGDYEHNGGMCLGLEVWEELLEEANFKLKSKENIRVSPIEADDGRPT